ncbi:MAG: hypothetical protein ACKO8W_11345 [Dolichospermum sp.]
MMYNFGGQDARTTSFLSLISVTYQIGNCCKAIAKSTHNNSIQL